MKRSPIRSRSSSKSKRDELVCDRLCQELAVARGACLSCGTSEGLAGHHLIPRRFKKYRHTARNIVTLCCFCHANAHDKPKEFELWLCREHQDIWRWLKINSRRAAQGLGPEPHATTAEK